MNKTIYNIFIVSICALCMTGVGLGVWNFTAQEKISDEKTISLNGKEIKAETIEMSLVDIYPGSEDAYTLHIKGKKGDSYVSTVEFKKTGDDTLAPYIDVEIRLEGQTLFNGKLNEYIGGDPLEIALEFDDEKKLDIEIVYSMSENIGDEAQNTVADFDLVFTAQR